MTTTGSGIPVYADGVAVTDQPCNFYPITRKDSGFQRIESVHEKDALTQQFAVEFPSEVTVYERMKISSVVLSATKNYGSDTFVIIRVDEITTRSGRPFLNRAIVERLS